MQKFDAPGDDTPTIAELARSAAESEVHALPEIGPEIEAPVVEGDAESGHENVERLEEPVVEGDAQAHQRAEEWSDAAVAEPPRRLTPVTDEPIAQRSRLATVTDEPVAEVRPKMSPASEPRSLSRIEEPVVKIDPITGKDRGRRPKEEPAPNPRAVLGGNSGTQLFSFIERIERLEEEKSALNEDIKEVYKEIKGSGFDTKMVRRLVSRRKKDQDLVREEDEVFELYLQAMGMR